MTHGADPISTEAIVMERPGGPDVLRLAAVGLPPPGPGEVRLRQTAMGVNYHDVYVRSGLYQTLPLPGVPGIEAVGIVEAVGAGVTGLMPGDRIGYVSGHYGCYARMRNLDAACAIKLPDGLTDIQWAASLLKAMTVCVLVRRIHAVGRGDTILVQAAAGGVGQLLCGWASHLGARVIGTVGSEAKAQVARLAGADHVILYREQDVAEQVAEITGGEGVAVVYDSVGADTFQGSLAALGYEGKLVNFGQASGPVPPVAPSLLATRSLSLWRPIIFHYLRSPDRLAAIAQDVADAFASGAIRPIDPLVLPLADAAQAHRRLEARQSPGGIVLT